MTTDIDNPRETWLLAIGLVALLAAGAVGGAVWIHLTEPENPRYLWLQALGLATVPGKYTIFSGLKAGSALGPFGLAALGIVVDTAVTLILFLAITPLGRVRGLGRWLRNAHDRAGEVIEAYPRLKRMTFWGVALFVFLPLPGTGAVGGSFASQLLGLPRLTGVGAVVTGSAITGLVFAVLATVIGDAAERIMHEPWVAVTSLVALVLFVWIGYVRMKRLLREV